MVLNGRQSASPAKGPGEAPEQNGQTLSRAQQLRGMVLNGWQSASPAKGPGLARLNTGDVDLVGGLPQMMGHGGMNRGNGLLILSVGGLGFGRGRRRRNVRYQKNHPFDDPDENGQNQKDDDHSQQRNLHGRDQVCHGSVPGGD